MSDLSSLIRLRKHTVDQKQKFLSGLYRQAEALEQQKASLNEKIASERKLLEEQEMLEALAWFGRYAAGVKVKIEMLDKDIVNMEQRIEIARADLRAAFAELKKVEITDERRRKEELRAENIKEGKELDDIAIEGYRRKSE